MSAEELGWVAPEVAWLLGVVAVLALGVLALFRWKAVVLRRIGDLPLVRRMTESSSTTAQIVRWVLILSAMAMIAVALMRPQYGTREAELRNQGIDVVIALDMSKSMMVQDVAPDNRLKASTTLLNGVLKKLKGGRVALVPFAGTAFVQTALTTDFQMVQAYLSELKVEDMPLGGTKIATAIRHATKLWAKKKKKKKGKKRRQGRDGGAENGEEDARKRRSEALRSPPASHYKAIILVTDGEDQEEDAVEAAKEAAKKNIQIYTVGVGRKDSAKKIPILNDAGERVGWVNDDKNMPIFSDLNTNLLERIAKASGGKAFVYERDDVARGLADALDELEKQEYLHQREDLREDRFQFLLIPAFLLLILETLISDRRRRRRKRRRA